LVNNAGASFVPLAYWNPANPIPRQLNKNNTNVNMPLPANLRPGALKTIPSYTALNSRIVPYHNPSTTPSAARCRTRKHRQVILYSGRFMLSC
jgi:hypothetical protein